MAPGRKAAPPNWDETKRESLTYKAMVARWEVVGPAYDAWRVGNAVPETGTPLGAWSGVTQDQARCCAAWASLPWSTSAIWARAPDAPAVPGARQLPKLAGDFLSGRMPPTRTARLLKCRNAWRRWKKCLKPRRNAAPAVRAG